MRVGRTSECQGRVIDLFPRVSSMNVESHLLKQVNKAEGPINVKVILLQRKIRSLFKILWDVVSFDCIKF